MKERRKAVNFSIKRRMQLRLFVKILGIAMIGVVLMAVVFYLYSNREIQGSFRQFHIHAENFLEFLLPAVVASCVLAGITSALITLFIPIKIAGPLYRIERDLKDHVAEGDLTTRFSLRKGDECGDLAQALNDSLSRLQNNIRTAQRHADALETHIKETAPADSARSAALLAELRESLRFFKV